MSHDDQEIIAHVSASLIAVFPLLLNSSFTPQRVYINAPSRITPRLMYPTNERRVSATLIIIQGISVNAILPVRRSFEVMQFPHSNIERGALSSARLIRVARRKRTAIIFCIRVI
jgi:hypothetical protein